MPQTRSLTDDELLSIVDEPALKAKLTPEEKGRLSVLQRAASGDRGTGPVGRFIENAVSPLAQAPGMMLTAAQSLIPFTKGGAAARQELGKAITEPHAAQGHLAAQAFHEGRPAAALGHGVAAAVPFIGPAVASGIEQMQAGDVAGGAGTLTGIAAPFVAGPFVRGTAAALKGTALGEGLANTLDRSAVSRLTDQMVPKVGPNKTRLGNRAAEIAPQLLRDPELGAYSRTGLADKIAARVDQAKDGLDLATDARLVSQQVKTGPLVHQLDAEIQQLVAHPVEASSVTPSRQITASGSGGVFEAKTQAEPFGRAVEPAPNTTQIETLRRIKSELEALGPVAPYESVRRIRQAWDQVAKVKYSPTVSPDYLAKSGEATGASRGTAAMREALAQTDPASANAYATYHLYKTADDVAQAAEEAQRVRPNRGRGMMARTAGALIGAREGGIVGAGVGAIAAGMADRAAEMAPTFQIAIARRMAAVADALRAGDATEAQALLDRTLQKFPNVRTTLRITGKMTPAAAAASTSLAPSDADRPQEP